jgi:hypothetical protein
MKTYIKTYIIFNWSWPSVRKLYWIHKKCLFVAFTFLLQDICKQERVQWHQREVADLPEKKEMDVFWHVHNALLARL